MPFASKLFLNVDIYIEKQYDKNMDYMELIIDFFKDLHYLGPGDEGQTKKALEILNIGNRQIKILDVGCGTGVQTIVLAKETQSEVIAVDFIKPFLNELDKKINNTGLNIKTLCAKMEELPFEKEYFDLIWSEGAVYNMGFINAINYLKKFIKPNGCLAVTEISWLTNERPDEIDNYWKNAYTDINTIENKLNQLRNCGYRVIDNFILPNYCWENYYEPIKMKEKAFLEKWKHKKEVIDFVNETVLERELFEKYNKYYNYVFYIAQKE